MNDLIMHVNELQGVGDEVAQELHGWAELYDDARSRDLVQKWELAVKKIQSKIEAIRFYEDED